MPYAVKIEIDSVVGWSCIFPFSYNILYSQGNDLTTDDLEIACIEVKLHYNKPFFFATCHRPSSFQINLCDKWALFLSKCDIENKEPIIAGNLN